MFHVEHFALVMEDGFEKYVRCSMWNIGRVSWKRASVMHLKVRKMNYLLLLI